MKVKHAFSDRCSTVECAYWGGIKRGLDSIACYSMVFDAIVLHCHELYGMVWYGWCWMLLNCIGWYWMVFDGTGWYLMVLDGIRWYWLVL